MPGRNFKGEDHMKSFNIYAASNSCSVLPGVTTLQKQSKFIAIPVPFWVGVTESGLPGTYLPSRDCSERQMTGVPWTLPFISDVMSL